jgi:cell division protein FtsX
VVLAAIIVAVQALAVVVVIGFAIHYHFFRNKKDD